MKKYIVLSFCMVISMPLCAMQPSSSSSALEGAFLQGMAQEMQNVVADPVEHASQVSPLTPSSGSSTVLQQELKMALAGLVGAGLGEGAYRLGFIKYEKTAVILGAMIGVSAFATPEQRKKIIDLALQMMTKTA